MISDRFFPLLERIDMGFHHLGLNIGPLCRLVGRMEIGYYERTTDWANPLFVKPGTEFYEQFADQLCEHGYRFDCPEGCVHG